MALQNKGKWPFNILRWNLLAALAVFVVIYIITRSIEAAAIIGVACFGLWLWIPFSPIYRPKREED